MVDLILKIIGMVAILFGILLILIFGITIASLIICLITAVVIIVGSLIITGILFIVALVEEGIYWIRKKWEKFKKWFRRWKEEKIKNNEKEKYKKYELEKI